MAHRNLSPRLNAICDGQLMYRDMRVGETLTITARDARTGKSGTFRVRVISLEDVSDPTPIFEFLEDDFALFGPDHAPMPIVGGMLAGAGLSAIFVPEFIFSMIGLGGIGIGRDYSFEYIGNTGETWAVWSISGIRRCEMAGNYQPPIEQLTNFLNKREQLKAMEDVARKHRQQRLKRAMTIMTKNSIYYLSAEEDNGQRTLSREGTPESYQGELLGSISVASRLNFDIKVGAQAGQTIETSTITAIDPDPDQE